MDKTVVDILDALPPHALDLRLARSLIRMRHDVNWSVDKRNEVHDLLICASGQARYAIDGAEYTIRDGQALVIRSGSRFIGRHDRKGLYTGAAQHFELKLFGEVDLFSQIDVAPLITFSRWPAVRGMLDVLMAVTPDNRSTTQQHHLFMALLLEFMRDAFVGWREDAVIGPDGGKTLSWHVVLAAARICDDVVDRVHVDEVLRKLPYNQEYFARAFRRYMGLTPQQYQQAQRLERAREALASGLSVKKAAEITGYTDTFYFSRLFKKHTGQTPNAVRRAGPARLGETPGPNRFAGLLRRANLAS